MPPAVPKAPHTLTDHLLGALAAHHHGDGDDHDHDHDAMDGLLAPGETGAVELISIGVDVGSSGTQVAFSRLTLEGTEGSSRLAASRRQTLYQSPVALTPYMTGNAIDEIALGRILDHAYAASGLMPDQIDCGVVILTGAAHEQANAEAITRRLAADCGDIVSASAGHHMEARLAAHGSGAVERSAVTGKRFLNVDIGGGTTKLAVCAAGRIEATAALAIGGRLIATDPAGRIVRIEPAGRARARQLGFDGGLGDVASVANLALVAESMADDLIAVLGRISFADRPCNSGSRALLPLPRVEPKARLRRDGEGNQHSAQIYLTAPLGEVGAIDGIIVSGGVGEYVYGRETRDFCDLGRSLGRAIAARINTGALPWPLMPAAECIRATVLGACGYTVQLSGRTGCITAPARLLPCRNAQVLHPACVLSGEIDAAAIAGAITVHLATFDIAPERDDVVLAFAWQGLPDYPRLRAFADGLARGTATRLAAGRSLRVIVDGDIAHSLGGILRDEIEVGGDMMILDGIALADFDFVDLGRMRLPSETVPVTIKTLVFRDDPVQKKKPRGRSGTRARTVRAREVG